MTKKICNKKIEVKLGIALNEKDHLMALLSILKEMTKNYAIVLTEVSNEKMYKEYKETFDMITSLQREVYEVAFKCGWYILEKEDTQKINKKYDTLLKEYEDLGIK